MLKPFGDFLGESKSDTIVFAYGRFQPPTVGHALLVNSVASLARQHNGKAAVFVSNSHDKSKNPLTPAERVFYLSKMFPRGPEFAAAPEFPDPTTGRKTVGVIGIMRALSGHFKNVVLIAGSDRVPEFKKKLNEYNGKLYNYQSINVVSAGERDPDDEGVSGMSGTKMRAAAYEMDFAKFRSGIPASLPDKETKELMLKIRKAMSVRESFEVHLPITNPRQADYKAVFLLGCPGSGKDFILDKALSRHGLTEITNSKPAGDLLEQRAGLIVNANADDFATIAVEKAALESLGYSCKAIYVHTSNDVSKARNLERESRGGRVSPEHIRESKWIDSDRNRIRFKKLFGEQNYIEFDNTIDLRKAADRTRKAKAAELLEIFNNVRNFVGSATKTLNENFEEQFIKEDRKILCKPRNVVTTSSGRIKSFDRFIGSGEKSIPVVMKKKKRLDEKR
jgi:hypothetical protein